MLASTWSRLTPLFVAAVTASGLSACSLGLQGEPEELQVEIEAEGDIPLLLVTSTAFVFTQSPTCEEGQQCPLALRVLSADTVPIAPPFKETFRFTSNLQYLVETFPADSVPATLSLKIAIDGRPWFHETRALQPVGPDGERETMQFVYEFNRPRPQL